MTDLQCERMRWDGAASLGQCIHCDEPPEKNRNTPKPGANWWGFQRSSIILQLSEVHCGTPACPSPEMLVKGSFWDPCHEVALEIYHSIVQDPSNPFIHCWVSFIQRLARTYLVSNSLAIPVNLTVNESLALFKQYRV